MIQKVSVSIAALLAGLALTGVVATWLRNTVVGVSGKDHSDRNVKTDVTPVRW